MAIAVLLASTMANAQHAQPSTAIWQVCFAPSPACSRLVVEQIARAAKTVRVQAYGFTDLAIAKAMIDAKHRGVDVQVILDRSNRNRAKYTEATFFVHAEVPTLIDDKHPIAHNKVIVIDDAVVITGSYNFTKHAQQNAENLLVLRSVELARRYNDNWTAHRSHSEKLE